MAAWPERRLAVESNILIIAVRPSEESSRFGGLIAELCRRGRPPFVTILTDGSGGAGPEGAAMAAEKAAAARRAVAHLGLPPERLLLIGLHDGAAERDPSILDALVSAFDLLSWARDCQTICVAGDADGTDYRLVQSLGERLSERSGLGCVLSFGGAADRNNQEHGRIDITRHLAAKRRAEAEYAAPQSDALVEHFALLREGAGQTRFWI
jgi:LmbE family N-acetylglucosaminyl deacetylase